MKKHFFYKGIFVIGGIYMKKAILMVLSLFLLMLMGEGCKQKNNVQNEELVEFKVNYSSLSEYASISCKMGKEDVKDNSLVKKDSVLIFTVNTKENYAVESWDIEGKTLTAGGNKGEKTCTIKVTSNVDVKCKVKCLLENGFNISTGVGVLDGIIFKMIDIPEAKNEKLGHEDEEGDNKAHNVTLDAFAISETEVTQELYEKVMGVNPSQCRDGKIEDETIEKRPVERVTWCDCIAFCNRLTQIMPGLGSSYCVYYSDHDLKRIYTKEDAAQRIKPYANWSRKGFRLPTSNEWEWAARGGSKENYWAGTGDEKKVEDYAWIDTNSDSTTHEVAKKLPNGYGLYDMSGNVVELCWDWYSLNISTAPQINPHGPETGELKIARGGGCAIDLASATVLHIVNIDPSHKSWFVGLRLAQKK